MKTVVVVLVAFPLVVLEECTVVQIDIADTTVAAVAVAVDAAVVVLVVVDSQY